MNLIAKGDRERTAFFRYVVSEARALHYWIMLRGKLYSPDEAEALKELPRFREEELKAVDPVTILRQQDEIMAKKIHDYNVRRTEFVRKINLTSSQKVM